jgi:hypothetical protein
MYLYVRAARGMLLQLCHLSFLARKLETTCSMLRFKPLFTAENAMSSQLLPLLQVHLWPAAVAEQCAAAVMADHQRHAEALWQDSDCL